MKNDDTKNVLNKAIEMAISKKTGSDVKNELVHIREKIIDKTNCKCISVYDNYDNKKLIDAINGLHDIALNSLEGTYGADTLYEIILSELEKLLGN